MSVARPTITIVPANAFESPCGAFVRLNGIGDFVSRSRFSSLQPLLATDQTTTARMAMATAAASHASTSIRRFTRRRRGSPSSRTRGPLSPTALTRVPRRRRLPPSGAGLRRRLTTLAAGCCARSARAYYVYCPSRRSLASFATAARGTRVSRATSSRRSVLLRDLAHDPLRGEVRDERQHEKDEAEVDERRGLKVRARPLIR